MDMGLIKEGKLGKAWVSLEEKVGMPEWHFVLFYQRQFIVKCSGS